MSDFAIGVICTIVATLSGVGLIYLYKNPDLFKNE
jgi:hypothetical protein